MSPTRRFVGFGTGGGGGGSGTVSANNGSAGALAIYAAAGGSTTVSADANFLDSSGQLVGPIGAAATPTYTFTGKTTWGMYERSNNVVITTNSSDTIAFNLGNAGAELTSGGWLAWAAGADPAVAPDTTFARLAPKTVGIGGAGDETGFLRGASSGRVTSDITLTVNTAITIFSFSFPAVAKAWGWQAVIPWVISAGTGTNTLAIGVNYSQTPTGTTGMCGEILTSNANAGSQAFTALSATGATTIITSGTITPGATVFQSSCSGTILASATAGTFTITMTAAGTTATALAKAGATCYLY